MGHLGFNVVLIHCVEVGAGKFKPMHNFATLRDYCVNL